MVRDRQLILKDIKTNPQNHKHSFKELMICCLIGDAIDAQLMEAHSANDPFGRNGGIACDVMSGPCACGAWH